MGRMDGKVAFITGGGRGQGRSHALLLAREGADVVVTDICEPIPEVAPFTTATEDDLDETKRMVEARAGGAWPSRLMPAGRIRCVRPSIRPSPLSAGSTCSLPTRGGPDQHLGHPVGRALGRGHREQPVGVVAGGPCGHPPDDRTAVGFDHLHSVSPGVRPVFGLSAYSTAKAGLLGLAKPSPPSSGRTRSGSTRSSRAARPRTCCSTSRCWTHSTEDRAARSNPSSSRRRRPCCCRWLGWSRKISRTACCSCVRRVPPCHGNRASDRCRNACTSGRHSRDRRRAPWLLAGAAHRRPLMKYGISFTHLLGPSPSPGDVIRFACEAEEAGFNSIAVSDHVLLSEFDASAYPAGTFPPDAHWYDPFVVLAAIAGATTSIRLATGVAVVPYRPAIQQAQAVASLDFMSGGRFVYGVGLGWMREEFASLGVPFSERGRRTDEYLAVMKLLWSGSGEGFHGEYIDFQGGRISPRPLSDPHPPILVGGQTRPPCGGSPATATGSASTGRTSRSSRGFSIRSRRAWQRRDGSSRTCTCSWPAPIPTSCGRSGGTSGSTRTSVSPRSPSCRQPAPPPRDST